MYFNQSYYFNQLYIVVTFTCYIEKNVCKLYALFIIELSVGLEMLAAPLCALLHFIKSSEIFSF